MDLEEVACFASIHMESYLLYIYIHQPQHLTGFSLQGLYELDFVFSTLVVRPSAYLYLQQCETAVLLQSLCQ